MSAGKRALTIAGLLAFLASLPVFADLEELRAAAAKGDAVRQLELGELYEFGFRMEHNFVPALAWYMLAAEQGNEKAASRRDALKSQMTSSQIADAEREAARLRPTSGGMPAKPATAPQETNALVPVSTHEEPVAPMEHEATAAQPPAPLEEQVQEAPSAPGAEDPVK